VKWIQRLLGREESGSGEEPGGARGWVDLFGSSKRELPKRRLHLGVDYGTAWSKLVLRDCASPRGEEAFVLRPSPPITLNEGEFRVPSVVVSDGRRLWFGGSAIQRGLVAGHETYTSLKIRASLPDHFHGLKVPLPHGLSERDIATLHIAYLQAVGRLAAEEYARRQRVESVLGFTLGVPASLEDNRELRALFASMGRRAWYLSERAEIESWVAQGLPIPDALELLRDAAEREAAAEASDDLHWVRNESVAALHWGFRSPNLGPGLYLTIDVGAGTTSAAWFRILDKYDHGMWEKSSFVFFGSACSPPGVDRIDVEISRGLGSGVNPAHYRGREGDLVEALCTTRGPQMKEVFAEIFKVTQSAFRRAYRKDVRQGAWSPSGLLLFGGGARIDPLRPTLMGAPWQNLEMAPELTDPGVPNDLLEFGGGPVRGDHDLLLVAYGLSFPLGDVPEYVPERDVDEHRPWRYASPGTLDRIDWDI